MDSVFLFLEENKKEHSEYKLTLFQINKTKCNFFLGITHSTQYDHTTKNLHFSRELEFVQKLSNSSIFSCTDATVL